jgi:hypothetical protein
VFHSLVGGELWFEFRVAAPQVYEGALVPHGVAVVGRGEDGDALAVMSLLVAVRITDVRCNTLLAIILKTVTNRARGFCG